MSILDIPKLAIEIEKRQAEYAARQDKDKHIKFLSDTINQLFEEISAVIRENESLLEQIYELKGERYTEFHFTILHFFVKNDYKLDKSIIINVSKSSADYEIAFHELIDWGVVVEDNAIYMAFQQREGGFHIPSDKKTVVLKLLKRAGKI